jgi:hypothetical protein
MDESTKKQFLTDLRPIERRGDQDTRSEGDGAGDHPNDENERPTLNPPFDLEAFARAHASSSPDITTARPPAGAATSMAVTPPVPGPASGEARGEPASNARSPGGRFPSALWMVDSLASSVPPPAPDASTHAALHPPASPSAPAITEITVDDPAAEMRERASLGDYTGALEMAELLLAADPGHPEATECMASCHAILEKMYSAKLGPLDRAPIVVVPRAQLRWLSIDHRAGFILSLIDGTSPIEMIIDVSGMPKLDALRILHELVQQRIVSFRT